MQANNSDDTSKRKYFVFKLIPPGPTFAEHMTEGERDIMTHHVAYWTDEADKRISIVFGPVFDPKGAYGLGIIEVENKSGSNSRCKRSSCRIQASKIGNLSGARNFAQIEVSDQPPWLWLVLMDSSFTPCFHGYSSEVVIRELM